MIAQKQQWKTKPLKHILQRNDESSLEPTLTVILPIYGRLTKSILWMDSE